MARKLHLNELAISDFLFDFVQYVDLSTTIWMLKTTSGFGKTGNSVGERRLTSNEAVTVEKRDI